MIKLSVALLALLQLPVSAVPKPPPDSAPGAGNRDEYRKLFAPYPKSRALDAVIEAHRSPIPKGSDIWSLTGEKGDEIIVLTRFDGGRPNVANFRHITGSAAVHRYLYNPYWSTRGFGSSWLSDEQMFDIREAVRSMPPSNAPASLRDLLIVTYVRGAKRVTRLYDTRKMPPIVAKIDQIGQERRIIRASR